MLRSVTTDVPVIYRIYQTLTRTGRRIETTILRRELTVKGHTSVLDIGCGPGDLGATFSSACYTGIDIEEQNIQYARRRWPAYRFEQMDARHLRFQSAAFDYIVSMFTCHHLSDDELGLVLAEAKRCLKATGRMLILDPSARAVQTGSSSS